jgi:hypothetical protein
MTGLASRMGLVRKDGILMTKEEAAGGYVSLKAEADSLGISERPGQSLRLAVALARAGGNTAPLAARNMPTARTVTSTKPKASTSKPKDRVQIVGNAVLTDPALKGKAQDAIFMLADPAFANVTAGGILKMLKAGATGTPPALASASTSAKSASAAKGGDVWGSAIARMGKPAALSAAKASMAPWDKVIGRMKAPAR